MESITLQINSSHACAVEFAPTHPRPRWTRAPDRRQTAACLPVCLPGSLKLLVTKKRNFSVVSTAGFEPAWPAHSMCRVHRGLDQVRARAFAPRMWNPGERCYVNAARQVLHNNTAVRNSIMASSDPDPLRQVLGAMGSSDGSVVCSLVPELSETLTFRMQKVDVCAACGAGVRAHERRPCRSSPSRGGDALPEVLDNPFSGTLRKKYHGPNRTAENFQRVDQVTTMSTTTMHQCQSRSHVSDKSKERKRHTKTENTQSGTEHLMVIAFH